MVGLSGHFIVKLNGKEIYEHSNLIVDAAFTTIIENALTEAGSGHYPLYRVGWGSGGYTGTARDLPSEDWLSYDDLQTAVGSQDLDSQSTNWDAATSTLTITNSTTFYADDYGLVSTNINEIALIAGTGTSGVQLSGTHIGANDTMFAYHTIDNKLMIPGGHLDVEWSISIKRGK